MTTPQSQLSIGRGYTFRTRKVSLNDVVIVDEPGFSKAMRFAVLAFQERLEEIIREFNVAPRKDAAK